MDENQDRKTDPGGHDDVTTDEVPPPPDGEFEPLSLIAPAADVPLYVRDILNRFERGQAQSIERQIEMKRLLQNVVDNVGSRLDGVEVRVSSLEARDKEQGARILNLESYRFVLPTMAAVLSLITTLLVIGLAATIVWLHN
jgi:hypothetical protein